MSLGKYWNKTTKVAASIVSVCTLLAFLYGFYSHFAKQSDHEALAANVEENFAKQEDLLAVNQSVQQTNYQFWIYQTKQEINRLWDEWRKSNDPAEKEQIRDQIEELEKDLQRYKDKLGELK